MYKVKLQMELSDAHSNVFANTMEVCGIDSKKGLVEEAVMLLGWATKEVLQGRRIASIDDEQKTVREFNAPAFLGATLFREKKLEEEEAKRREVA